MIDKVKAAWNSFKYRGPSSSHDFNQFIDDSFEDFTALKRAAVTLAEETSNVVGKTSREQLALARKINELSDSVRDTGTYCYADLSDRSIVGWTDRNDTAIPLASRLHHSPVYGYISLNGTMYDVLAVRDESGFIVPDYVETAYTSTYEADAAQGDDTRRALSGWEREVWERVSLLNSDATPTQGSYFVRVPSQLLRRPESNCLIFHPFPNYSTDYIVKYTTDQDPVLTADGSTWNDFPDYISYVGSGTTGFITNSQHRLIQFPLTQITALRIDLRQQNAFLHDSSYIFSFGIRHLSAGYLDYSSASGMIRITVQKPTGNFTEVQSGAVITYSNLPAAYDTGNISSYCWIDPEDATKAYIELSMAMDGSLTSPAGNSLTYSPQIATIGVQYT